MSEIRPKLKLVKIDYVDKYTLETTACYFNPHDVSIVADVEGGDDMTRHILGLPSYAVSKIYMKNGKFVYSPKTVHEITKDIHEAAND